MAQTKSKIIMAAIREVTGKNPTMYHNKYKLCRTIKLYGAMSANKIKAVEENCAKQGVNVKGKLIDAGGWSSRHAQSTIFTFSPDNRI